MYVQCRSSDKKFSHLGTLTGYMDVYTTDQEAREAFFDSLIKETDFYTDDEKKGNLKVLSVKRAGASGSPYLEFTAIGDFYGETNVPITGLIAFQSPAKVTGKPKITIVKKSKITIIKK